MSNFMMQGIKKERIETHKYGDIYGDNKYANGVLTQADVVNATLTLLFATASAALVTIYIGTVNLQLALLLNTVGAIGTIVMTALALFSRNMKIGSPIGGMLLAIFQGLMLGGFTYSIGYQTIGGDSGWNIVGQALLGTVCLFFLATFLYKAKIIRPSSRFISFLILAIGGFGLLYLANFVLTFILGRNLLFSDGPIPIVVGCIAIILGTLSLIVDFQSSDQLIRSQAQKEMKWAIATAIVSSLVWLYMELLRVLTLLDR